MLFFNLKWIFILAAISFIRVHASDPLSLHELVVVESGKDAVIRLRGYDLDGDSLSVSIDSLPSTGLLTQLSHVYSDYGYLPIKGTSLAKNEIVSGSYNRVYYQRPKNDVEKYGKWDTFEFHVHDGTKASLSSKVTLVPPSGTIVGSQFLTSNEGWTVVGNGQSIPSAASHERSSRGRGMSYFIHGSDALIDVPTSSTKVVRPTQSFSSLSSSSSGDRSLWYFQAPSSFYQHDLGIAYGGVLEFTLSSFSGNFRDVQARVKEGALVLIECDSCAQHSKVTLAFPLSKALKGTEGWDGLTKTFSLPLVETSGWLQDPENKVKTWRAPTKCTFIEVLSNLSNLKILGDFTNWYESVGLDNVRVSNTKNQLPVCAQGSPDASVCSC